MSAFATASSVCELYSCSFILSVLLVHRWVVVLLRAGYVVMACSSIGLYDFISDVLLLPMLAGYADMLLSLFRSWRAISALEQVLPWIIGFCESFFFYVLCSVIWYGSGYISTSCGILHDVPSLFGFIGMMPCAGFASSF